MRKLNLSVFVCMAILFFVMGNAKIVNAQGNSQSEAREIIFGLNSNYSNVFNVEGNILDGEEHWWKFEGEELQSVQFMAKSDSTNAISFLLMEIIGENGKEIENQFYYKYDNSVDSSKYNAMCKVVLLPKDGIYYVKVLSVGFEGSYDFMGANPALLLPFLSESNDWFCSQGNNGNFSHNINSLERDYRYSWDFSHSDDFGYVIAPASGVVVYLNDSFEYSEENDSIYLVHNNCIDMDHDIIQENPVKHEIGNVVILKHGDSLFSVLPHIKKSELQVELGDTVLQGQILGQMWKTEFGTNNHIHYHLSDGTGGNIFPSYLYFPGSIESAFVDYDFGKSVPVEGDYYKSKNIGAPIHLQYFDVNLQKNNMYFENKIFVKLILENEFEKDILIDDIKISLEGEDGIECKNVETENLLSIEENFIFELDFSGCDLQSGEYILVAKVKVDGRWIILGGSHDGVCKNRISIYFDKGCGFLSFRDVKIDLGLVD